MEFFIDFQFGICDWNLNIFFLMIDEKFEFGEMIDIFDDILIFLIIIDLKIGNGKFRMNIFKGGIMIL